MPWDRPIRASPIPGDGWPRSSCSPPGSGSPGWAGGSRTFNTRPDELTMIKVGLQCGTGDFNPHAFFYPSLLGYVLFVCYVVLAGYWKLIGSIASAGDVFIRFAQDPSAFFLSARLISALAGTATVGVVYWLGRRIYGTRVGLAAAFLLAVAWLPVRDSHFGCVDTPMAFLGTLSLVPAWNVYQRGARRDYLWAGVLIGLAASTKYYGAAAAVAIAAAHVLRARPNGERPRLADLVAAGLASAATFLVTSPFVVLNLPEFWRDFHTVVFSLQGGHLEVSVMRAWRYHLLYTLPRGLTVPIFLAGMVGLAGVFVRDWRRALVVFSYPLVFFALIGWSWVFVARYTTATWPFLRAGGRLVAGPGGRIDAPARPGTPGPGMGGGPRGGPRGRPIPGGGRPSPAPDAQGRLADSRHDLGEGEPPRRRHDRMAGHLLRPSPLAPAPESLARRLAASTQEGASGLLLRKKIELAQSGPAPQFLVVNLSPDPSNWNEEPPEYLLMEQYRLFWVRGETRWAAQWLEKGGYQELRRWEVTDPGEPLPYCDPQDAVYLPFGQMSRVRRSGPELILYRRSSSRADRPDVASR